MAARRLTLLAAAVALAATTAPRTVGAQTSPSLVAIVELAQNGMTDSARGLIRRLVDSTPSADPAYPEILYTSGVLAATEYERRIALRRVVVEYSTSAWADHALLLIGQVEYANGNPGLALAQFSRLIADYPRSPVLATAAFWGARAAGDLRDGDTACRLADLGLAVENVDVELGNQLRFQRQRCAAVGTQASADSGPSTRPAPPPAPPPAAPARTSGIFVQAIAAPTAARGDEIAAMLRDLGYPAVVVREGGFFKVRAGPFDSRGAANTALARIRNRVGGRPFLVTVR